LNAMTRWGIIGCGDVTEVKSGPAFQKATGSALVAVMRRDLSKAQDYARRHGVPRAYDRADALINDPDVDAVYIATHIAVAEDRCLQDVTAASFKFGDRMVGTGIWNFNDQRRRTAGAPRSLPPARPSTAHSDDRRRARGHGPVSVHGRERRAGVVGARRGSERRGFSRTMRSWRTTRC
jgi:Oxidoreductase family, NAD-binding Rossmann fold